MWTAFGIMLGTAFNLAVYAVPDINWRLMLGAPFLPAVPLLILIYLCPESPRWYMKKRRYAEAWKSMNQLRHHPIQVARDMYYISAQLAIEEQLVGKSNYVTRFTQLFTIPRVRRANLAAFTVMIAQQMCGINIIAFYSTTIFSEAGMGDFNAMLGSFGFGMVNWLFAFPAFWTIDTVSCLDVGKGNLPMLILLIVRPSQSASLHLSPDVLDPSGCWSLHAHSREYGQRRCTNRSCLPVRLPLRCLLLAW